MELKLRSAGNRNMAVAILVLLVITILALALCWRIYGDTREHSSLIGGRIDEITTLLGKYSTTGIYGKFFNSSEPRCSEVVQSVVNAFIQDFSDTHNLTDAETARIREVKTRPDMMPVTLLLHSQLMKREKGRFVRGRNLTAVFMATGVSALIMPPLAGMAMHNMSLWLLPFLNTAVFFSGLQLLRYAYSDAGLMNVLVTGKPD